MISKPDCIWCDKAADLILQNGECAVVYDYQEHPMIVKLMFEAALKTVPQVWYNGTHIGGYEDLVEWFEKT
jgi:glutaredoxin